LDSTNSIFWRLPPTWDSDDDDDDRADDDGDRPTATHNNTHPSASQLSRPCSSDFCAATGPLDNTNNNFWRLPPTWISDDVDDNSADDDGEQPTATHNNTHPPTSQLH
jgi:hypothetical protein